MEPDECAECGEPCRAVITEGGLRRNLELTAHPSGNHLYITRPNGTIRVRVLDGTRMPAPDGRGYRIHRCPRPAVLVPCATCGEPMSAFCSGVLGRDRHVGWYCDQGITGPPKRGVRSGHGI